MLKTNSQKQEARVAKQCGGRVQAASGALDGAKGDVRNKEFLIECKTTDKEYYLLTYKVWDKIRKEAIKDGLRIPAMIIELQDKEYVFVDCWTYLVMAGDYEVCEKSKYSDNKASVRIEKFEENAGKLVECFGGKYVIIDARKFISKLRGEC